MEVIFESQGRAKIEKKWLHKNVSISPKNRVTKKDNFFTVGNVSGCWQPVF